MTATDDSLNVSRESIAAEVRAQLARHRRSGRSVALEIGWNQAYLSRRLTGEIAFNVDDLVAIAAVLDVPVASFFQGPPVSQLRKQLLAVAA